MLSANLILKKKKKISSRKKVNNCLVTNSLICQGFLFANLTFSSNIFIYDFFIDSAKQTDEKNDVDFNKLISKSLEKLQETENQKEQKTVKYCSVLIKDVRKHPWWGPKVRQLSGDRPVGAGGSTTAPSGINRSKLCSSEPSTSTKVRKVWQINIARVKGYNFCSSSRYFQTSFLLALKLK